MGMPNQMARMIGKFDSLPSGLRRRALGVVLGRRVPFVGTVGLQFEELSEQRVVTRLRPRRRVQNHIHTLHAAAVTLAAETASGFVVGMNLPDDKLPLMKSLQVDFVKRNEGGLRASASLSDDQKRTMREEPRGEVEVPVEALDDAGQASVRCRMVWAWVPRQR
jgi:acyl-coenzyme A thioesterase PaaI-like protein